MTNIMRRFLVILLHLNLCEHNGDDDPQLSYLFVNTWSITLFKMTKVIHSIMCLCWKCHLMPTLCLCKHSAYFTWWDCVKYSFCVMQLMRNMHSQILLECVRLVIFTKLQFRLVVSGMRCAISCFQLVVLAVSALLHVTCLQLVS